jgi:hypothetical protein
MNNRMRKTIKTLPKEFIGNSPEDIISDPHTIANRFNDYFVNVGQGIARIENFQVVKGPSKIIYIITAFFLNQPQNTN